MESTKPNSLFAGNSDEFQLWYEKSMKISKSEAGIVP
jgi:hypothetical protein